MFRSVWLAEGRRPTDHKIDLRSTILQVVAGQTAALALKKVKRNLVRKGMVLVGDACHPEATWEFDADIAILTHSTTIQPRYQAVIHCEIVRQVGISSTELPPKSQPSPHPSHLLFSRHTTSGHAITLPTL